MGLIFLMWGPWSNEHGAGITALKADSWDRFVRQNKLAKPFWNAGWRYKDKVEWIMPYTPKGTHVFRPRRGRPPKNIPLNDEPTASQREGSPPWDMEKLEEEMSKGEDHEAVELGAPTNLQLELQIDTEPPSPVNNQPAPSFGHPSESVPPKSTQTPRSVSSILPDLQFHHRSVLVALISCKDFSERYQG
ncbi:hypothetical protein EV360DRAFT_86394 [Lentinula raphanica]|nr:hypothetical protein EV360DRAFT_86394 [Lentinula raphanica]